MEKRWKIIRNSYEDLEDNGENYLYNLRSIPSRERVFLKVVVDNTVEAHNVEFKPYAVMWIIMVKVLGPFPVNTVKKKDCRLCNILYNL